MAMDAVTQKHRIPQYAGYETFVKHCGPSGLGAVLPSLPIFGLVAASETLESGHSDARPHWNRAACAVYRRSKRANTLIGSLLKQSFAFELRSLLQHILRMLLNVSALAPRYCLPNMRTWIDIVVVSPKVSLDIVLGFRGPAAYRPSRHATVCSWQKDKGSDPKTQSLRVPKFCIDGPFFKLNHVRCRQWHKHREKTFHIWKKSWVISCSSFCPNPTRGVMSQFLCRSLALGMEADDSWRCGSHRCHAYSHMHDTPPLVRIVAASKQGSTVATLKQQCVKHRGHIERNTRHTYRLQPFMRSSGIGSTQS
eukprot:987053-Amphidinium_carterae.1